MSSVVQMTYAPAHPGMPHAEVLDFDDLRRMNNGNTQRADFLVLAFVSGGTGLVALDFEQYPLAAGCVVWIGPGSVHQWIDFIHLRGKLVICEPTSPLTAATRAAVSKPRSQPVFTPGPEQWNYLRPALDHLLLEAGPDVPGSSPELHAVLLTALLMRIPGAAGTDFGDGVFERFRAGVDAEFRQHRDVGHYARELGYAERTLTRKVLAATGRTAKGLIDERVVLEAKRLLVHHRLSAASCASELGFADPSAFSVYFQRVTGVRPGAWQAAHSQG